MTTERLEVSREIAAPPAKVFALLCEPNGHVTIDSSGMLQSAEGERVRQVGDKFVVHMDGRVRTDVELGKYDVTVIITKFEQDALIEWTVGALDPPVNHFYGYRLQPTQTGTLVTSYYDWSQAHQKYRDRGRFPVVPEAGLRATLAILDRNVR